MKIEGGHIPTGASGGGGFMGAPVAFKILFVEQLPKKVQGEELN